MSLRENRRGFVRPKRQPGGLTDSPRSRFEFSWEAAGKIFWRILAIWAGVQMVSGIVLAQHFDRDARHAEHRFTRRSENPKPEAKRDFYFGVMGQIARPGVYAFPQRRPQLRDLIRHAGGLTEKATDRIRVVRLGHAGQSLFYAPTLNFTLVPGDIVVAEGKREPRDPPPWLERGGAGGIQNADFQSPLTARFSRSDRQVALVNLLDHPVILPVPESRANLPALLEHLGQDPSIARDVKILPVGPRRIVERNGKPNSPSFTAPTILDFPAGTVRRDRLPKLPQVHRIDSLPGRSASRPGELPSAETASPSESGPLLVPPYPETREPTEPESKGPPRKFKRSSEPPPSRKSQETKSPASGNETSWWSYLGLMFLLTGFAGLVAMLLSKEPRLDSTGPSAQRDVSFADQTLSASRTKFASPETSTDPPLPKAPARAIAEEIQNDAGLAELVFNQLPVLEETGSPVPVPEETPQEDAKPQKRFRIDPAEEQQSVPITGPNYTKRPRRENAKPAQPEESKTDSNPADSAAAPPYAESTRSDPPEEKSVEAEPSPGLLDRVLRQVNQSRAA